MRVGTLLWSNTVNIFKAKYLCKFLCTSPICQPIDDNSCGHASVGKINSAVLKGNTGYLGNTKSYKLIKKYNIYINHTRQKKVEMDKQLPLVGDNLKKKT